MELAVLFAALNVVILVGLLLLYGRIAWRSRATHSLGLLIFAILLFLQNGLTIFSYIEMAPFFQAPALPFLLGISALEFGGLIVLLRITL